VGGRSFGDAEWTEVLSHLETILGPEARRYAAVPAARLTAAIPYLAGSEDPDRFAVSNLLTFHGATQARAVFDHRPSDDADPALASRYREAVKGNPARAASWN
jgi:hypothetical protein